MESNQPLPRVGIVNCVSQALEMLRFSSEQLIENAGTDDFDYIIVCWHTTPEVDAYIASLTEKYSKTHPRMKVVRVDHKENAAIGFVPNLREMMNEGFREAFKRNEYGGLVNTDQAFYKDWLKNLAKHCSQNVMVSVQSIMPGAVPPHCSATFGATEYGKFDLKGFEELAAKISKAGGIVTEADIRGDRTKGFMNLIGLPYLHSRAYWEKAGPWETNIKTGTPDVNFWKRAHKAGFSFIVSMDSIAYHVGGAERRAGKRTPPDFAKGMEYEPMSLRAKITIRAKVWPLKLLQKAGIIKKPIFI